MKSSHRTATALCVLSLAALWTTACRIGGQNPRGSPVATSPHGTTMRIDWRENENRYWSDTAELLAVSDSGLHLLHGAQIVFYRFGLDARLAPRGVPGVGTLDLREPDLESLETLMGYARYPFGLAQGRMEVLLQALGRDSVVVRRSP